MEGFTPKLEGKEGVKSQGRVAQIEFFSKKRVDGWGQI